MFERSLFRVITQYSLQINGLLDLDLHKLLIDKVCIGWSITSFCRCKLFYDRNNKILSVGLCQYKNQLNCAKTDIHENSLSKIESSTIQA